MVSSRGKEHWPEDRSLKLQYHPAARIILQKTGKWTEIPYVQIFFRLRDMKELCLKYGIVVCIKSEPTRQMVLGTDNQKKVPTCEGSPPMAPKLPGATSLYSNMPPYLGAPPPQKSLH